MYKAELIINKDFRKAEINPLLYGSFVEHMGRVVYSGIYEPGHQEADEDGFRKDVISKVKEMGVTCVRYPGGNFVSCYNWKAGVGKKEERPRLREIAWKSIETNQFGTDEFMDWAKKAEITPLFAVNLGTRGVENAVSLLEYCNLPAGTRYSDWRCENGHEDPYGIPIWCLGNEMDGIWQIGHKTPEDYGKLAGQTAHAMKSLDPNIKTVVCGSSSTDVATYTDWERIVLEYTYEFADYISLHQYYGGQERGTDEFLSQSVEMEEYIQTVIGICDTVKSKKRSDKKIDICFDEWGVWEIPGGEVADSVNARDWEVAPAFSEQIYTMEDALLFASMMMAMIKNCERVKAACQSLLTNISAAIMTEPGAGVWVQPIFYPFSHMAAYGRGVLMESVLKAPSYRTKKNKEVPYLDQVAILNEEADELVIFLVNRRNEAAELDVNLQGFCVEHEAEHTVLFHNDIKADNRCNHENVKPLCNRIALDGNKNIDCKIRPYSWNMIRVQVKQYE
ncbi:MULTISPECIES: alpha-N-arabinofuranosidase [Clostridia]|uniref:arabinosylfuranosidase ArfA n=1 Tax=Clostridia TaxID=186801 RepID=UPI00067F132D|nr:MULTISPECIES: alpha-N-arabinofuranosidase [Clostridia]